MLTDWVRFLSRQIPVEAHLTQSKEWQVWVQAKCCVGCGAIPNQWKHHLSSVPAQKQLAKGHDQTDQELARQHGLQLSLSNCSGVLIHSRKEAVRGAALVGGGYLGMWILLLNSYDYYIQLVDLIIPPQLDAQVPLVCRGRWIRGPTVSKGCTWSLRCSAWKIRQYRVAASHHCQRTRVSDDNEYQYKLSPSIIYLTILFIDDGDSFSFGFILGTRLLERTTAFAAHFNKGVLKVDLSSSSTSSAPYAWFDWWIGWLIDWLIDGLIWSMDGLIDWFDGWMDGWMDCFHAVDKTEDQPTVSV